MKSTQTSKLFFILVFVLLMTSFAFAGGKPTPPPQATYSWAVEVIRTDTVYGANPAPYSDPDTTRNFVTAGNNSVVFNFEVLDQGNPLQLILTPGICATENACNDMFAILNRPQPDGSYGRRIYFLVSLGCTSLESMEFDTPYIAGHPSFSVDTAVFGPDAYKNTIKGFISGDSIVTRTGQDEWLVQVQGNSIDISQYESIPQTVCKGGRCQTTYVAKQVATGTAGPIDFNLIFSRTRTN